MKGKALLIILSMLLWIVFSSWGFFAHQKINRLAVFSLPQPLLSFFKLNLAYIEKQAVTPDKLRYLNLEEAPRHYFDVEDYEPSIAAIPRQYKDALKKYGHSKLQKCGILPWHIQRVYFQLVKAFKNKNEAAILRNAAYLGHYISDAHVPLHTTSNHNGQYTNQIGIHAFWESTIPEYFSKNYNLFVGKAKYIEDPLMEAWNILTDTHAKVDSVLFLERKVAHKIASTDKYAYIRKGASLVKQPSEKFAALYEIELKGMVAIQMRKSILSVSSFWYSAWVDAGQPSLNNLVKYKPTEQEIFNDQMIENQYIKGDIKGKKEN